MLGERSARGAHSHSRFTTSQSGTLTRVSAQCPGSAVPGERTHIAELPHLRAVLLGECSVPGERTQIAEIQHPRALLLLG